MRVRGWLGLPSLIVGFSGAATLSYQIIWERLLGMSFGAEDVTAVLVTSTFLLGLGAGAVVFGRRWRRPYRVYAFVEIG